VTLDSMAAAFDVGLPFLDAEVSDFICAGRISAKIDKVCCCLLCARSVLCARALRCVCFHVAACAAGALPHLRRS
jgi:hypothetical protein